MEQPNKSGQFVIVHCDLKLVQNNHSPEIQLKTLVFAQAKKSNK
jgi:hypothetical protein